MTHGSWAGGDSGSIDEEAVGHGSVSGPPSTEFSAGSMAFNMTAGMTVWMRHRGHSWARVAEMAAAMFVPAIAAIVLFWAP